MSRHITDSNSAEAVRANETCPQTECVPQTVDNSAPTDTVLDLGQPVQVRQKRGRVPTEAKSGHEHICSQSVCLCPKIPKLSHEACRSLLQSQQEEEEEEAEEEGEASRRITIESKSNNQLSASIVSKRSSRDVMTYCSVQNLSRVREHDCTSLDNLDGCPTSSMAHDGSTIPPKACTDDYTDRGHPCPPQCMVRPSYSDEDLEQDMITALKRGTSAAKDNTYSRMPWSQESQHPADSVAEKDPTALCSCRCCRKKWTQLGVQKMSASADGISNITSVGSTSSEPQPACEERSFSPMLAPAPPGEERARSPLTDRRPFCENMIPPPTADFQHLDTKSPSTSKPQLLYEKRVSSPVSYLQPLYEKRVSFPRSDPQPLLEERVSSVASSPQPPGEERVCSVASSPPQPPGEELVVFAKSDPQPILGERRFSPESRDQPLCGEEDLSLMAALQALIEGHTLSPVCDPQPSREELVRYPLPKLKRVWGEPAFPPVSEPKRICEEREPSPVSEPDHFRTERISSLYQSTPVLEDVLTSSSPPAMLEPQHLSDDMILSCTSSHERASSSQHSHETGISDLRCPNAPIRKKDSAGFQGHCANIIGDHGVFSSPSFRYLETEENALPLAGGSGRTSGGTLKRQPPADANKRKAEDCAPRQVRPYRQAAVKAAVLPRARPSGELLVPVQRRPGLCVPPPQLWRNVMLQNTRLYHSRMESTQNSSDDTAPADTHTSGIQTVDTAVISSGQSRNGGTGSATTTADTQAADTSVISSIQNSTDGALSAATVGTQTVFSYGEVGPTYSSQDQATNDEVRDSQEQGHAPEIQDQKWKEALPRGISAKSDEIAPSILLAFFELVQSKCPFMQHLGKYQRLTSEHVEDKTEEATFRHSDCMPGGRHTDRRQRSSRTEHTVEQCRPRSHNAFGERHPLRRYWQQTTSENRHYPRASDFSEHLGQGSTYQDEDEVSTEEGTDENEPGPSQTASSLQLDQNLRLANATAIQNISGRRRFMPLTGNLPSAQEGVADEARPQPTKSTRRNLRQKGRSEPAAWPGHCSTSPSDHPSRDRSRSPSGKSCRLGAASHYSLRKVDRTTQLTPGNSRRSSQPVDRNTSVQHPSAHPYPRTSNSQTCVRNKDTSSALCTPADQNYPSTSEESQRVHNHHPERSQRSIYRSRSRSPSARKATIRSGHAGDGSRGSGRSSQLASVCGRSDCARRAMDRPTSSGSDNSEEAGPSRHPGRPGRSSQIAGARRRSTCTRRATDRPRPEGSRHQSQKNESAINASHDKIKSKVNDKSRTASNNPSAQNWTFNFTLDKASESSPTAPVRRTMPVFSFHNPVVPPCSESTYLLVQNHLCPHYDHASDDGPIEAPTRQISESESSGSPPQPKASRESKSPRKVKKSDAGKKNVYVGPFSGVVRSNSSSDCLSDDEMDIAEIRPIGYDMVVHVAPSEGSSTGENLEHCEDLLEQPGPHSTLEEGHHQRGQEEPQ